LNALLRSGLLSRGWRITTPEPVSSGILAAVPHEGEPRRVAGKLEERNIIVAAREGAVRFSPHFYNDADEIRRTLEALDEFG